MKPVVFMFSGQGSQYYHMGRALFEGHPVFRKWMYRLDEIVAALTGISALKCLYDNTKNKMDVFSSIEMTSLAIIMVEYAMAQVLMNSGILPDIVLGSSLGEVTATLLADSDDLTEALRFVFRRMVLYNRHCPKGGMIGILAPPDFYRTSAELNALSELAAINFDSHFVVSCQEDRMNPVADFLKHKRIIHQIIANVSKAYHSSLLDPAEPFIRQIMKKKAYRAPTIKFISCTHARQITTLDRHYFWDVFRKPILFQKTIQSLEKKGSYIYLDVGPSGTLANYVKYNLKADSQSEFHAVMSPFGGELERLEALGKRLRRSNGGKHENLFVPRSGFSV